MTLAAALGALMSEIPDETVRHAATRCVVDWAGCAIGGSRSHAAAVVASVANLGHDGECAILGTSLRGPARDASLVNGVSGHVLDFDDESAALIGHPGAVVIPAVLALAECHAAPGQELLDAVAAGYQAAAMLGAAANPGHYSAGWHATATLGRIASTVACARVLKLPARQAEAAACIACTQAAGLRAAFGSPVKAVQVGSASSSGVICALLAARGIEPPTETLACYLAATGGEPDRPISIARPGILDTIVKRHAACGAAQCLIEAVAAVVHSNGIDPASIRAVRAHLGPHSVRTASIDIPNSLMQAQFSLRHLAALAAFCYPILYESLASPPRALDRLRQQTTIIEDASLPVTAHAAWVEIDLADGSRYQNRVDVAPGDPAKPTSDSGLDDKFLALAQPVIGENQAREMLRLLWRIPTPTGPGELFAFIASHCHRRQRVRHDAAYLPAPTS
jgi:2-methylcitrate dehydratase PrpD